MALRALGQAGERVRVRTATDSHAGRLGRVGADHVDLLPGEGTEAEEVLTLPFAAVLAVHEAP